MCGADFLDGDINDWFSEHGHIRVLINTQFDTWRVNRRSFQEELPKVKEQEVANVVHVDVTTSNIPS